MLNIYLCQYRNKNYKLEPCILVYPNVFITEMVCKAVLLIAGVLPTWSRITYMTM